jgi:dienelactone hydrolase
MQADAPMPSGEDPAIVNARHFVTLLVAGDHGEAVKEFDATMVAALPAEKLAATWNGLITQVGTFETVETARVVRTANHVTAILSCKFARARLETKVTYDNTGKIAGLFFVPAAPPYTDPPYVDRRKFEEHDVTVGSGAWALPGTLSLPNGPGPFRAIVLVHGSGPNDRDESIGANRPFKDLAGGLASRGIAVLRYDKRTKVYGAKMAAMVDATVDDEVVGDALAAVELLRGMKDIDAAHIVIAGHSLGGFLAPRIAKRSPHVSAIAILAGSTRGVPEMMIEQMNYIASVDPRQATAMPAAIAQVKAAAARIADLQRGAAPKPGELVLGAGAAYWKDFGSYDGLATAKQIKQPIFVAQGGRDYQVTRVDYDAWRRAVAGRPDVTFVFYPELNHLLAPGNGSSTPEEYELRTPVDLRLIEDLARWVSSS